MNFSKKNLLIKLGFILFLALFVFAGVSVYMFSDLFLIKPTARQNHTEVLPDEPFVIDFSNSIDKNYYKKKITLKPRTPMTATVSKDGSKITLTPKDSWETNTNYKISIPKGRSSSLRPIKESYFSFRTVKHPEVEKINPESGVEDVVIDEENKIKVDFNKSTEGFFIDFALEPTVEEVEYYNNDEKTSFEIIPKNGLEAGIEYKLVIRSKPKNSSDDKYKELSSTTFTTLPPQPISWAEELDERLVQAEKYTQPQIRSGKYIDINLSTQIMTIFEDGDKLGTFLVSSGRAGMGTPKGRHQIYNKHSRAWSSKYSLYMPYWMAITSDGKYGIHELPEWPSGYKEGQNHLGIAVSHGCVRLGVGNSQRVYDWAEVGTPVIVY